MKLLHFVGAITCILILSFRAMAQGADKPNSIVKFDKPLLFTYLSWDKRVTVANGLVEIRATPKGGGGANLPTPLDLTNSSNDCPAIKLNPTATNKAPRLRLMLIDSAGRSGTWSFPIPASGVAWVTPVDGGSLLDPEDTGRNAAGTSKGKPDLSQIVQYQLVGDWSSDMPLEVNVLGITTLPPSQSAIEARAAKQRAIEQAKQDELRRQKDIRDRYGKVSTLSPKLVGVSFLGPDLVVLEVSSGRVFGAGLAKYVPQPGDSTEPRDRTVYLSRGGRRIAYLVGPKRDWQVNMESFEGDPLIEEYANDPAQFHVTDKPTGNLVQVTAVDRKSRPIDAAMPDYQMVMQHHIYLHLSRPLQLGKAYELDWGKTNIQKGPVSFVYDPAHTITEAIHVNQIGFRPDDPLKRAFLSVWLGTGGTFSFGDTPSFRVVDDNSGEVIATGKGSYTVKATDVEELWTRKVNYSGTDVYRLDFPQVTRPGVYRVVVDGVGSSPRFSISNSTWAHAFKTQMKGLFNQRSGMVLGPPYTTFRKPRDFYPGDGQKVYASNWSVLDKNEAFAELESHSTGRLVSKAWGGYHDAGDWNPRRVTHMKVTMAQLELMELFPKFFARQDLNIPKPTKAPDILNEALWELDCFRRMQEPDGGIHFGIETNGDPLGGEVSWLQSMDAFTYATDPYSSWFYASVAIRFSELVKPYDAVLSKTYRQSAIRAMNWAEENYPKVRQKIQWDMLDTRNLAALLMYRNTKDPRWESVFKENTVLTDPEPKLFVWGKHVQTDAAFVYALLPKGLGDTQLKKRAMDSIKREADTALDYAKHNGWNITTNDRYKPLMLGYYSSPNAFEVVRAHVLTRDPAYLKGAIQACLFTGGANPNNETYTSGLGAHNVRPFKIDYRLTGQPIPDGLTVYGNCDYIGFPDNNFFTWPIQWHVSQVAVPSPYVWPIHEALFETYLYPATEEFVIDQWAPNVYVWGYLAARPSSVGTRLK